MPRDTDSIERDIERARDQLAKTLDELTVKANPKKLVEDAKTRAIATLNKPAVKFSLVGVGALAFVLVIRKIVT